MIERIGSVDRIPDFVAGVKAGKERLMGFGHRIYKNYDPRAKVIKLHGRPGTRASPARSPLLDVGPRSSRRSRSRTSTS